LARVERKDRTRIFKDPRSGLAAFIKPFEKVSGAYPNKTAARAKQNDD